MAADAKSQANPIWLLPSAMTLMAFYKDIVEFGQMLAAVCRGWMVFFRELWSRIFSMAPPGAVPRMDPAMGDMLTLWVTSSIAIWAFPLIAGQRDGRVKTTVEALEESFGLPANVARGLAFTLIALAVLGMAAPLGLAASPDDQQTVARSLQASTLISPGGREFRDWFANDGAWLAWSLVGLGGALLTFVFFVIGPILSAAILSKREKLELTAIGISMWVLSGGLLAAALFVPASGIPVHGLQHVHADLAVLSLLTLIGLVAWRSALPFVQLALLILAVLTLDAAVRFGLDVWSSTQHG